MIADQAPGLEVVPTVHDLWAKGLAEVVAWTAAKTAAKPTHFRIKPEGQQLINDAMARNARKAREHDERQREAKIRRTGTEVQAGTTGRVGGVSATLEADDGLPY